VKSERFKAAIGSNDGGTALECKLIIERPAQVASQTNGNWEAIIDPLEGILHEI